MMPPKKRTIIAPPSGWRPQAYYVVKVAYSATNPIHKAIFYSGFLDNDGVPLGYNQIWSPLYEIYDSYTIDDAHYLKAIKKIKRMK